MRSESPEAPYNASKAAVIASRAASRTSSATTAIRVNCVAPGETLTPEEAAAMTAEPTARLEREYVRRIPLRRLGTASEQAAAVLFLASDDASFVSGETLVVDGGELAGDWYDRSAAPPLPERIDGLDCAGLSAQPSACSNLGSSRTAAKSSSLRASSRNRGRSSIDRCRWANVSSPVSPASVAKHA